VLPASTGGVSGRRRARRVETGLTETVGRREAAGAAVFNSSGVTPVVIDEGGWVLQLDRDPGVRWRRSIVGKAAQKGGVSPERGKTAAALGKIRCEGGTSGGQRQRSERGNGGREVVFERRGPERGR
jgi:hypothetical protein